MILLLLLVRTPASNRCRGRWSAGTFLQRFLVVTDHHKGGHSALLLVGFSSRSGRCCLKLRRDRR